MMESTGEKTAKKDWIEFRAIREPLPEEMDRWWVFTDGSVRGRHAAVIINCSAGLVRYCVGTKEIDKTRNVGSEISALLMGLNELPQRCGATVVSDYLGIGAWMTGNWGIRNDFVFEVIGQCKDLIVRKNLDINYIHHQGHQVDDTYFTIWNNVADGLCGNDHGLPLDSWLPLSAQEIIKVRLSDRDRKAKKKLDGLRKGWRHGWYVVSKPKYHKWYRWVDEFGHQGQCRLPDDAPDSIKPVLLTKNTKWRV